MKDKSKIENKAVAPDENKGAKNVKPRYSYPLTGITVEANSQEEADKLHEKAVEARKAKAE